MKVRRMRCIMTRIIIVSSLFFFFFQCISTPERRI
jgi:hypothetical protein